MAYLPVPNYPFFDNGVTTTRDVSQLDANFLYLAQKIISVKDYGAVGNNVADDTVAIQAAVTAAGLITGGGALFFPPGQYKITAQINILRACYIWAIPTSVTIYISTSNQNGFVIGDGTTTTRPLVGGTRIDGLQFAPPSALTPSTSGACILASRANGFTVTNCSIVGVFSGTNVLFNGISVDRCLEWTISRCKFNGFVNNGIRCVGTALSADNVTDGRIDFCEVVSSTSDAIYLGDYTAAITINSPIIYSFSGWGIKIDCTAASGVGFNYFIFQPDIEASTTTSALGGIYAKQCASAQVVGGWLGGTAGVQVDSTAGGVDFIGLLNQGIIPYVISGKFCSIVGGDVVGDNATTTTGITINTGANNTLISGTHIRQFTTEGIKYVGTSTGCILRSIDFASNGTNITNPQSDMQVYYKNTFATTLTSGTGTLTTASAVMNYTREDNLITIDCQISITTNGTGAVDFLLTIPYAPARTTPIYGVSISNGFGLTGYVDTAGGGRMVVFKYDGTYPGADNKNFTVGVTYSLV